MTNLKAEIQEGFKCLRCKKEYGIWYYKKIMPSVDDELDAPIYELYDCNYEHVNTFAYYNDMKYYIATGILI